MSKILISIAVATAALLSTQADAQSFFIREKIMRLKAPDTTPAEPEAPAEEPPKEDILKNGSFDSGTSPWTGSLARGGSGSYITIYEQKSIAQQITGLTIGQTYNLTFMMSPVGDNIHRTEASASVTMNGKNVIIGNWSLSSYSTPNKFIAQSGTFVATAETALFLFQNTSRYRDVRVDDFSIK